MDKFKFISQSAKLKFQYDVLLQKVQQKGFTGQDAEDLGISKSKASRVLNKKNGHEDLYVLAEMAAFRGIEVDLIC